MEKQIQKIGVVCSIILLLSLSFVVAQSQNKNTFHYETQSQLRTLEQHQNMFENKYNFDCSGECKYREIEDKVRLEIREQRKFLFWNVESHEVYDLNEEGEIIFTHYNIWSRLLNRDRLRIEQ